MADVTNTFENQLYCDFSQAATKAIAGKDILLAIFNSTGDKLLAIAGQQGLKINRSKDTIEITSKDNKGGWKSKIGGMKEWTIDNDGIYVLDDESHIELGKYFDGDDPVCIKVIDTRHVKGLFGGLAIVTDYSFEAPFDDSMTYSIKLEGMGALVDLAGTNANQMPGLTVTAVTLNKATLSLTVGSSEKLVATIAPANAGNDTVTWISDTPTKATVSADGTVTGVATGAAKITVTTIDGEKTAVCNVTVTAA